jgi:PKD repeat protein
MKTKLQYQTKTFKKLLLGIFFLVSVIAGNKAFACTANFTYNTGLNGLVNFTSTSVGANGGTHYEWDANDGSGVVNTGNVSTYSHYYLANGTYNVLLYIYDSLLVCNDSIRLAVVVSNVSAYPCQLSASLTYVSGLDGQVTFTSTSAHTNPNT